MMPTGVINGRRRLPEEEAVPEVREDVRQIRILQRDLRVARRELSKYFTIMVNLSLQRKQLDK